MIHKLIAFDLPKIPHIVEELFEILKAADRVDNVPSFTEEEASLRLAVGRRGGSRTGGADKTKKRHKWTDQETEAMISVIKQGGTWTDVNTRLPHLSIYQCQVHLGVINKKKPKDEKITVRRTPGRARIPKGSIRRLLREPENQTPYIQNTVASSAQEDEKLREIDPFDGEEIQFNQESENDSSETSIADPSSPEGSIPPQSFDLFWRKEGSAQIGKGAHDYVVCLYR